MSKTKKSPKHEATTNKVTCRKPIHEQDITEDDSDTEPIHKHDITEDDTDSDGLEINKTEGKSPEHVKRRKEAKEKTAPSSEKLNFPLVILIVLLALVGIGVGISINTSDDNTERRNITLDDLKEKYTTVSEKVWSNFEVGLQEINNFEKPSVLIFLHEHIDEASLKDFLLSIAEYGTYNITGDIRKPIFLTSSDLNTTEFLNDHGNLITKYRRQLKDNGMMIVTDLDQVPSQVAQGLHAFCDEYSPLVPKSFMIFTIEMDKLNPKLSYYQQVEKLLRHNWQEIKDDIFDALITRLSNMIVKLEL